MPDLHTLTHAASIELDQGPRIGWDQAAMNCADKAYPDPERPGEADARQEKIEYVGEFMRKVVALPLEPVVFYRPGTSEAVNDDHFYLFDVITPDPKRPVEIMFPSDEHEQGAILRLNPIKREVGELSKHTVAAGFQTNVDTRPDSNVKVWFGIGNSSTRVSPDNAYREQIVGTQAAVGSKEVAELFTSLRADDTVLNGRLFGALFNIAWMAHDLEVSPAGLGDFGPEKRAAVEAVNVRRSAAVTLAQRSGEIARLLQEAEAVARSQTEGINAANAMYQESVGDVYIQPLYDSRDVHESVTDRPAWDIKSLKSNRSHVLSQAAYQRKAIDAYDKQLIILASMV